MIRVLGCKKASSVTGVSFSASKGYKREETVRAVLELADFLANWYGS